MPKAVVYFKKLSSTGQQPKSPYEGDAGSDLYVAEKVVVPPQEFRDIPSHLSMALPEGYWARIIGRSSTLRVKGLIVSEGIIDNGWRGDLFAGVFNITDKPVIVEQGERLAQIILHKIVEVEWRNAGATAELAPSERGEKGFGSSGR